MCYIKTIINYMPFSVIDPDSFISFFPFVCLLRSPHPQPRVQVAESKPLVIQADVMQRELESCLRREYTPENLPLLLLQVRVILQFEK